MGDFDSTTVSIRELPAGNERDLPAEAEAIIAVDTTTREEEVVYGRDEHADAHEENGNLDD